MIAITEGAGGIRKGLLTWVDSKSLFFQWGLCFLQSRHLKSLPGLLRTVRNGHCKKSGISQLYFQLVI